MLKLEKKKIEQLKKQITSYEDLSPLTAETLQNASHEELMVVLQKESFFVWPAFLRDALEKLLIWRNNTEELKALAKAGSLVAEENMYSFVKHVEFEVMKYYLSLNELPDCVVGYLLAREDCKRILDECNVVFCTSRSDMSEDDALAKTQLYFLQKVEPRHAEKFIRKNNLCDCAVDSLINEKNFSLLKVWIAGWDWEQEDEYERVNAVFQEGGLPDEVLAELQNIENLPEEYLELLIERKCSKTLQKYFQYHSLEDEGLEEELLQTADDECIYAYISHWVVSENNIPVLFECCSDDVVLKYIRLYKPDEDEESYLIDYASEAVVEDYIKQVSGLYEDNEMHLVERGNGKLLKLALERFCFKDFLATMELIDRAQIDEIECLLKYYPKIKL
ncbi:MAG: hypothetical protein IJ184_04490 [Alphaproteobacteria bacterium]|nr:hypothetical protein [Alphaproteobacteria bacterium]